MPAVIVEVGPEVAPAALLRELLAACSAAMREATCDVAKEPEPEETIAVAIVKWNDATEGAARIEVGIRHRDRAAEWETRAIGFRKTDSRVEKWRAAGLTIATLVGDRTAGSPANATETTNATNATRRDEAGALPLQNGQLGTTPPPSTERQSPEPESPGTDSSISSSEGAPPAARSHFPWWLGGGAVAGSGFGGGVRVGGYLDGGWQSRSPLFVRGSLGLSGQPETTGGVVTSWGSASIGGGLRVDVGPFALRPQVALRLDGLRATVGDASQTHVQLGGQVGADLVWASGPAAFSAGVDAWRNRSPTEVRIGARSAGTDDGMGWGARLGFAYLFGKSGT